MPDEYGEFVGVRELYTALVLSDTSAGYSADTPEYLAPVGEIAAAPKVTRKVTYYENKPRNIYNTEAETEVKVVVSGVPAYKAARYLGKYYDAASGRVLDTGKANPPFMALGFIYDIGNDDARYYWYLKGTFSAGSEEAKSRETDVDVKTYELTFTAIVTTYQYTIDGETEGCKRVFGDTPDEAFDETGWFTQVQTPLTATPPSAIALSTIVPDDEATGVAIDATIVLTFNNKIAEDKITVISEVGALIACTKAYNATGKILTITPNEDLSASTVYIVAVSGVVDIYGQELAAVAKNFETVS